MFTIDQIKAAHSKVKSGADFPAYVRDIKQLGVIYYETFVSDNHTVYYGINNYRASSPPKYDALTIADRSDDSQFRTELKAHQQGKSNYFTFCKIAASLGVEKWIVSVEEMTCTYFNKAGDRILVEVIPDVK
ncbi:DUF1398 family protein [Chryseolinea sp. T2]|uniref:DUF1398 domain-containing protein n=1 Tax=Chryseolinea sp. T2 TaxID=3129255 RepID=UPI003076EE2E